MTEPFVPRKVLDGRRQRAFLSFRRRSDVVFFLVTLGMVIFSEGVLVYKIYFEPPPLMTRPADAPAEKPSVTAPAPAAEAPSRTSARKKEEKPSKPEPKPEPKPEAPAKASPKTEAPSKKAGSKESKETKKPAKSKPSEAGPSGFRLLSGGAVFGSLVHRNAEISGKMSSADGRPALRVDYDLKGNEWAQVYRDVKADLARFSKVRFKVRGEGKRNTLEFKVQDGDGSNVGYVWNGQTGQSEWLPVELPLANMKYLWGGDGVMNWGAVTRIYFAVSLKPGDENGGGTVWISDVEFF